MRRLLATLAVAVTCSTAVLASPKIISVTPNHGSVTGGTTVIIRGTGFSDTCIICSPPFADPSVYFGNEQAASVKFVDATTIEAVTPPHIPETVAVRVQQLDGSNPNFDILENAFTYEGDVYDAFEPVLFPIYMRPVQGAFGSEFRTTARVFNQGFSQLPIIGIDRTCTLIDPPLPPTVPIPLEPRGQEMELPTGCSDEVARLFFVPIGRDKELAGNIRVWENTRQAQSHGVEIPVVHRSEFTEEALSLLGVPIDPRFRNTLRIYGLKRGENFVNVSINGELHQLPLTGPADDPFTPAVTTFTDFPLPHELPTGQKTMTVTIDVPRGPGGVNIPGTPIWAFISVTNNETQEITTITPN